MTVNFLGLFKASSPTKRRKVNSFDKLDIYISREAEIEKKYRVYNNSARKKEQLIYKRKR